MIHFPRDLNTLIRVSGHPHSPMRTVLKTEHDYTSDIDYERKRPREEDGQYLLPPPRLLAHRTDSVLPPSTHYPISKPLLFNPWR